MTKSQAVRLALAALEHMGKQYRVGASLFRRGVVSYWTQRDHERKLAIENAIAVLKEIK